MLPCFLNADSRRPAASSSASTASGQEGLCSQTATKSNPSSFKLLLSGVLSQEDKRDTAQSCPTSLRGNCQQLRWLLLPPWHVEARVDKAQCLSPGPALSRAGGRGFPSYPPSDFSPSPQPPLFCPLGVGDSREDLGLQLSHHSLVKLLAPPKPSKDPHPLRLPGDGYFFPLVYVHCAWACVP